MPWACSSTSASRAPTASSPGPSSHRRRRSPPTARWWASTAPGWELLDGSGITAKAVANAPGATENDIPWLKLEVNSHKGAGQLDSVTTVQRINTKGGVLKGSCDRERGEGMPYEAD